MAEYIPNQPVYFGDDVSCSSDEIDYKQLSDNGDTIQFQLRIDKCPGAANLISNGDFTSDLSTWTLNGGWYYSAGKANLAASSEIDRSISKIISSLAPTKYYCIEIEVTDISGGYIEVRFTNAVTLASEIIGTIYSPGVYKFFGSPLGSASFPTKIFEIRVPDGSVSVSIESVKMYDVKQEFVVIVYEESGAYVGEFSYQQDPELFVFYKNTLTVSIPWQEIEAENGCYYLCVVDPCTNTNGQNYPAKILNCSFGVDDSTWSYPGWIFNPGFITMSIAVVGADYAVFQPDVFEAFDVDYHITLDVVLTGSARLDVLYGTNNLGTITSSGTHNFIGKAVGNKDFKVEAYITSTPGTVQINSICPTSVMYGNAEIDNCEFDAGMGEWVGTGWDVFTGGGNNGVFTELTSLTPERTIIQTDVFGNINKEYGVRLRSAIGPGEDVIINVYFGTALVKTITATGDFEFYGYPSGNSDLKIVATLNSGSSGIASLYYVCPIIRESEYDCNFISNYFKVMDLSNTCNILVNACNNNDAMGFVFGGSGFSPRTRVSAKLKQAKYPAEKNLYDSSSGERKVINFSSRKAKNFVTGLEPEYMHDFLRTLVGYDTVYFNGVAYVCDDTEYSVDYGDLDYHGSVKVLFSEKIQQVSNTNCTDEVNDCKLAESLLLRADDLTSLVTQTDGSGITING
jgi:hypothetical protein